MGQEEVRSPADPKTKGSPEGSWVFLNWTPPPFSSALHLPFTQEEQERNQKEADKAPVERGAILAGAWGETVC